MGYYSPPKEFITEEGLLTRQVVKAQAGGQLPAVEPSSATH